MRRCQRALFTRRGQVGGEGGRHVEPEMSKMERDEKGDGRPKRMI